MQSSATKCAGNVPARVPAELPAVPADIFTRAAAIVAKRAAKGGASTDDIEAIVARGVVQAAALRQGAA